MESSSGKYRKKTIDEEDEQFYKEKLTNNVQLIEEHVKIGLSQIKDLFWKELWNKTPNASEDEKREVQTLVDLHVQNTIEDAIKKEIKRVYTSNFQSLPSVLMSFEIIFHNLLSQLMNQMRLALKIYASSLKWREEESKIDKHIENFIFSQLSS